MNASQRPGPASGDIAREAAAADMGYRTLTIQPEPIDASLQYITMPNGAVASGIRRDWADGKGEACTRCTRCNLKRNVCFVLANWEVDESEGRHFWPSRYRSQDAPATAPRGWRTTKGQVRRTGRSAPP